MSAISNEIYSFFAQYVYKNTGILYLEKDYYRLDARLKTLMKHFNLATFEELHQKCKSHIDSSTHELIIDLFTNNETYFMRDLKPFKAFAQGILPQIKKQHSFLTSINIWSSACSTGQEPYSILMSAESFGSPDFFNLIQLEASDISQEALKKAKDGVYTDLEVQRGLPASFLVRYFDKGEGQENWMIQKRLINKVKYSKLNLLEDSFPLNKYHIIFCRNVLIYQDNDNKRKILQRIYQALKPQGFLLMGAGESMIGMNLPFKHIEIEGAWFYQRD